MEPYVAPPPRDDGGLGVRADAVVGVRTLGPDAPLTSDDLGTFSLSHDEIEESHDRKSHDRKPRLPHKPPARRLTMQLTNGVQTLDAYQPTFDPGLDVATVVFSHIECVKTRASLAKVSKLWRDASKPTAAYPRFFDFDGVAGDVADHLVRLLDDDRVRSLEKERALELIGVHKDRLCEYACGRNFEVLKWAFNELHLPWAQYPAEPVSDDILALRALREMWPKLKEVWPENEQPEDWEGVTMENGRVVELRCGGLGLTGAVPAGDRAAHVADGVGPPRQSADEPAGGDRAAHSLTIEPRGNQLTSLPAEMAATRCGSCAHAIS